MKSAFSQDRSAATFRNWYSSSTVRSRPYGYLLSEQDFREVNPDRWFPSSMAPALAHTEITNLPLPERLHLHINHLTYFLDYTTDLEITHVNKAVKSITHGPLKKYFDSSDHRAALKLYVDEGYHALFSRELADQVTNHFKLKRRRSARINAFSELVAKTPSSHQDLTQFIIAFVSETLITKELFDLSRQMLIPGVYNLLIDHLHDEGKHSAYFSYCFEKLWSRLSESQQDFAARSLLEILLIFGRPDKEFILSLFASDTRQGELVLKHLEARVTERIAALAIPTMQTVQRTTLLQKHDLLHLFKTYGILT